MKFRMEYKVLGYDVWGNEVEGFEVNDLYPTPFSISVTENMKDETIINKLIEVGYLDEQTIIKLNMEFCIEGEHGYYLYVYREHDRYPMCELRPVEEEYG